MRKAKFKITNQFPYNLCTENYFSYGHRNVYQLCNWLSNKEGNYPTFDTFHQMVHDAKVSPNGAGESGWLNFRHFVDITLHRTPMTLAIGRVLGQSSAEDTRTTIYNAMGICADLRETINIHCPRKTKAAYKYWHRDSKRDIMLGGLERKPLLSDVELGKLFALRSGIDSSVERFVRLVAKQKIITVRLMGIEMVMLDDPITNKALYPKKKRAGNEVFRTEFCAIWPFGSGFTAPTDLASTAEAPYFRNFGILSNLLNAHQRNDVLWLMTKGEVNSYVYSQDDLVYELRHYVKQNQKSNHRYHNFKKLFDTIAQTYEEHEASSQVLFPLPSYVVQCT